MGTVLPRIDDDLRTWIAEQHLFFVASAPLAADGHVNLSPKSGMIAVLGEHEVAYLDLTGSGAETIAHLRENGRIVVMLCAFTGPPRILRLHGRGVAVLPGDPGFAGLAEHFPTQPGLRALIRIQVQRITSSCGFGVPFFDYRGERDQLDRWAEKQGPEGITAYQARKNRVSIDGLPAVPEPGAGLGA